MPPYRRIRCRSLSTRRRTLRNKLTTAFRPVLAIPHALLVGPVFWSSRTGSAGLLGAAAYLMAIVSWFMLLLTGEHPRGIREFCLYYLRWRTRNLAYMGLFADAYPPFARRYLPGHDRRRQPACSA